MTRIPTLSYTLRMIIFAHFSPIPVIAADELLTNASHVSTISSNANCTVRIYLIVHINVSH